MTDDSPSPEPPESAPESDDDSHGPRFVAINLSDLLKGAEGGDAEGLPSALSSVIGEVLRAIVMRVMVEDLQEHVTPQVASEVLWCYGDFEGTSEPSLANAALINLIRVANISDEHIMAHLAEIEHFRGYLLGVAMLAEKGGESGLEMLRTIAQLDPKEGKPEKS